MAREVKFMRKRLDYNWKDCKTNTEVLNELKMTSVVYKYTKRPKKSRKTYEDTDEHLKRARVG